MIQILSYQMRSLSLQTELLEALDWDESRVDDINKIFSEAEENKSSKEFVKSSIIEKFGYDIWKIINLSINLELDFLKSTPEA